MATRNQHIEIARGHKHFITFIDSVAESNQAKCNPEIYCTWMILASYYRVVHLLEAIFVHVPELTTQPHATLVNEAEADQRRGGLLKKLHLTDVRDEYRSLRRLALQAKYFPGNSVSDYDVITQPAQTREKVVNGLLRRIERLVAPVLNMAANELE